MNVRSMTLKVLLFWVASLTVAIMISSNPITLKKADTVYAKMYGYSMEDED